MVDQDNYEHLEEMEQRQKNEFDLFFHHTNDQDQMFQDLEMNLDHDVIRMEKFEC